MIKEYAKFFTKADLQKLLFRIRRKVYTVVSPLKAEYTYSREPVPFEEKDECEYKPIKTRGVWSKDHYGCAWFHLKGKVPESVKGKHVALLVSVGGEGCLIDGEGTPVQGTSGVHAAIEVMQPARGKRYIEFKQCAEGGEEIDIWVEAGNNKLLPGKYPPTAKFKQADIVVVRDDVKELYYDALALGYQLIETEKGSAKYKSIKKSLSAALSAARGYTADSIKKAREVLKNEMNNGEENPYKFYATGHAHLDLAWLWPIRETKRKAGRTFANALRNIERYDGYIFGASQPQQFEWVEQMYPELFEQIKKAIADGRIEPQGGMWVECDTNVTSGEALIRQCLYGKKYWKEKFGKDPKVCWLPDVFGFSGNIPQIIKKCGMDYFLTIKLGWNEHNKFPKRTFIWEGIDDSSVLVHMPPADDYNSDGQAIALNHSIRNNPDKDKSEYMQLLYGVGDGGGGPGEAHIAMVEREQNMKGLPTVKFAPAIDLFTELNKQREKFEVFKGELYLEKHQGTYTTQSNNKYFNRRIEFLLHNVEFLYTAAGIPFPKEQVDKIWKEILLYQFHDIIPGSSIKRVYDESVARYQKIYEELNLLIKDALTAQRADKTLTAINPTSFKANEIVKVDDKFYVADVAPYSAAKLRKYNGDAVVQGGGDVIENDLFIVKFDKNGGITSLVDKKYGKEISDKYLNRLLVYRDKKLHYNAWDIDIEYPKHLLGEFMLIDSETRVNEAQVIRENIYSYGKSSISQKVILTAGKPIVEFSTVVDWQETHKMLRAEFNPTVFSDKVTCDIQMGNLKRSTKNETSVEKAQFEICAHKWVDVSDDDYGLSVLSEGKYGWRVKEGVISLNLLRSPMWPAPNADKGTHTIRYALYPHNGGVFKADTAALAYQYNNPLIITYDGVNIPSLASSSKKNIVVETIKPAESGEGAVIRVYEDSGEITEADLTFGRPYEKVYETDMLENIIAETKLEKVTFKPYEIKTFLIK